MVSDIAASDNTPRSYSTTSAWAAKLRDFLFDLEDANDDHEPRFRNDRWREVFNNQVSVAPIVAGTEQPMSLFSFPLKEERAHWHVWLAQEALWHRLRTLGHVAVLEGERLKVRCFSYPLISDLGNRPKGIRRTAPLERARVRYEARGGISRTIPQLWTRWIPLESYKFGRSQDSYQELPNV